MMRRMAGQQYHKHFRLVLWIVYVGSWSASWTPFTRAASLEKHPNKLVTPWHEQHLRMTPSNSKATKKQHHAIMFTPSNSKAIKKQHHVIMNDMKSWLKKPKKYRTLQLECLEWLQTIVQQQQQQSLNHVTSSAQGTNTPMSISTRSLRHEIIAPLSRALDRVWSAEMQSYTTSLASFSAQALENHANGWNYLKDFVAEMEERAWLCTALRMEKSHGTVEVMVDEANEETSSFFLEQRRWTIPALHLIAMLARCTKTDRKLAAHVRALQGSMLSWIRMIQQHEKNYLALRQHFLPLVQAMEQMKSISRRPPALPASSRSSTFTSASFEDAMLLRHIEDTLDTALLHEMESWFHREMDIIMGLPDLDVQCHDDAQSFCARRSQLSDEVNDFIDQVNDIEDGICHTRTPVHILGRHAKDNSMTSVKLNNPALVSCRNLSELRQRLTRLQDTIDDYTMRFEYPMLHALETCLKEYVLPWTSSTFPFSTDSYQEYCQQIYLQSKTWTLE